MLRNSISSITLAIILSCGVIPVQVVQAAPGDVYVTPTGSDVNACDTPATPCATINAAIGKAGPGDTVYVAAGTYTGTGDPIISLNQDVAISGGWDLTFTSQVGLSTLDGQDQGMVIYGGSNCISPGYVTASLDRLKIVNGYGANGGGNIYVYCTALTLTNSEVSGGNASGVMGGGAILSGSGSAITIINSLIANNWADGANEKTAISSIGSLTLINTTVSGDERHGASGIAIWSTTGPLVLRNTTITGYAMGLQVSGSQTTIDNSVLFGSGQVDCTVMFPYPDTVTFTGRNIIGAQTGCGPNPSDLVGPTADPGLGVLQDNGGLTATHAVAAAGPAHGAGLTCTPTQDQRGAARPAACTLGAFEPLLDVHKTVAGTFEPGGTVTYTIRIGSAGATPRTGAVLTDTLPAPLLAVPGSATASAGIVALTGNTLSWSGDADTTTPAVLAVQAVVDPTAPGQVIANTAIAEWQGYREPSNRAVFAAHRMQYLPSLASQYCGDFADDFSNPNSGWPAFEDTLRKLEYTGGEYRLTTRRSGFFFLIGAPTCGRTNYSVQADMHWVGAPGGDIGLYFGDDNAYIYLFSIDTLTSEFFLVRGNPDNTSVLVARQISTAIHTGTTTNQLRVEYRPGSFVLRINGSVVLSSTNFTSNAISWAGLLGAPYINQPNVDARFDNFSVVRLPEVGATSLVDASADAMILTDRTLWPLEQTRRH